MSKRTALSSFCKRKELEVSKRLGHEKWRKDILNFATLWNFDINDLTCEIWKYIILILSLVVFINCESGKRYFKCILLAVFAL